VRSALLATLPSGVAANSAIRLSVKAPLRFPAKLIDDIDRSSLLTVKTHTLIAMKKARARLFEIADPGTAEGPALGGSQRLDGE
jgi:hypothetical protein